MTSLRLAYFGLPLGALLLLRDGHDLALCTLAPVEAPGRRRLARTLRAPLLDALVLGAGLEAAVFEKLAEREIDLVVSWFWTRRLPEQWLGRARFGGIGVHPSLLPRHRGPNPYFWAIDEGDTETGVSVHVLDKAYDTGAIYAQSVCATGDRNAWQLARALDRPSLRALRDVVLRFATGAPPVPTPQPESGVTWAPEPSGSELAVDWAWSTRRVLRRIRALSPVPGLALEIRGVRFSVTRAEASSEVPAALRPGEAGILDAPPWVVIRTTDGAIALLGATPEGDDVIWSARELRDRLKALPSGG